MEAEEKSEKILRFIEERMALQGDNVIVLSTEDLEEMGVSYDDVVRHLSYLWRIDIIKDFRQIPRFKDDEIPIDIEDRLWITNKKYPTDEEGNILEELEKDPFIHFQIEPSKLRDLLKEKKEKLKIEFDKGRSVLLINNKKVFIQQKNDKPNSHYVLEYIFENPEGTDAKHYYSEIIESKFEKENVSPRSIYNACRDINDKVARQADIKDFFIIKSGERAYVEINPKYT